MEKSKVPVVIGDGEDHVEDDYELRGEFFEGCDWGNNFRWEMKGFRLFLAIGAMVSLLLWGVWQAVVGEFFVSQILAGIVMVVLIGLAPLPKYRRKQREWDCMQRLLSLRSDVQALKEKYSYLFKKYSVGGTSCLNEVNKWAEDRRDLIEANEEFLSDKATFVDAKSLFEECLEEVGRLKIYSYKKLLWLNSDTMGF